MSNCRSRSASDGDEAQKLARRRRMYKEKHNHQQEEEDAIITESFVTLIKKQSYLFAQ